MSTQRPAIVFDRKPFPKAEAQAAPKKVPQRVAVRVVYPTPQEVQNHAVVHQAGGNLIFIWGRWRLTMADGQQRDALLTGVLADRVASNSEFKYKKGWAIYECVPNKGATVFEPEFYADMTPLKADRSLV